jgi:lambda family phage portal protein
MLGTVPGTDAQAPQISAEPGEFMGLPEGYTLSSWNPQYPHEQFGAFVKSTLRGISAGLDVSYHTLAGDLEAVNFSSARAGTLEERETWKGLQQWLIESLCEPLYTEWLQYALAAGALSPLPPSRFDKFNAALWQGRRWSWVDPMKDIQANAMAIEQGLTTRGRVIREQGGDPEEIWLELEKENARLAAVLPQRPAAARRPARFVAAARPAGPDREPGGPLRDRPRAPLVVRAGGRSAGASRPGRRRRRRARRLAR